MPVNTSYLKMHYDQTSIYVEPKKKKFNQCQTLCNDYVRNELKYMKQT